MKEKERRPQVVDSDLVQFHDRIQPGDRVLVMRPGYVAFGNFVGLTPGRFNLEEQFVDLSGAVVLPPVFDVERPGEVSDWLASLELEKSDHAVELGNRDFLVLKIE